MNSVLIIMHWQFAKNTDMMEGSARESSKKTMRTRSEPGPWEVLFPLGVVAPPPCLGNKLRHINIIWPFHMTVMSFCATTLNNSHEFVRCFRVCGTFQLRAN